MKYKKNEKKFKFCFFNKKKITKSKKIIFFGHLFIFQTYIYIFFLFEKKITKSKSFFGPHFVTPGTT